VPTFTRRTATYDATTDTQTVAESTIAGSAIQVRGDPRRYVALGLVLSEMPTLFFAPATYGECPAPGDTVVWPDGGDTWAVRDVDPIAPDGVVIAARVVIGR
jgi:hypothetical protein